MLGCFEDDDDAQENNRGAVLFLALSMLGKNKVESDSVDAYFCARYL